MCVCSTYIPTDNKYGSKHAQEMIRTQQSANLQPTSPVASMQVLWAAVTRHGLGTYASAGALHTSMIAQTTAVLLLVIFTSAALHVGIMGVFVNMPLVFLGPEHAIVFFWALLHLSYPD